MSEAPIFELRSRLGVGGFGEVTLALMRRGDEEQLVALKRMHPELAENDAYVLQFRREAKISSLLDHPHVVKLIAYGVDAEGPYLALEYVDGCAAHALQRELERQGQQLPLNVALAIARDAARGLTYAHQLKVGPERGVVHRDISPDNILVSHRGVSKLSDFGIAKAVGGTRMTETGLLKGKYGYMAPELFDGREATLRTDIFAFGATLYRLLAGVSPFRGRTDAELLKAILKCRPEPIESHRELPEPISGWINDALQKKPAARPASIASLLALLEAEIGQLPDEGCGAVRTCMSQAWPEGPNPSPEAVARLPTRVALKTEPTPPPRSSSRWLVLVGVAVAAGSVALGLWSSGPDPGALTPLPGQAEVPIAQPKRPGDYAARWLQEQLHPPPPTPPPLTHLDIKVTSDPPGASVQLDGVPMGRTPLVLNGLRPGERYKVDVHKAGWFAWSETIVADGHEIVAPLKPLPVAPP